MVIMVLLKRNFSRATVSRVDVEFQYNAEPAYQNDVLQDAISYETVYRLIEEVFTSQNFKLLETLVFRMIQTVIEVFLLQEVCVRVRKPSVPIKGVLDFVSKSKLAEEG